MVKGEGEIWIHDMDLGTHEGMLVEYLGPIHGMDIKVGFSDEGQFWRLGRGWRGIRYIG